MTESTTTDQLRRVFQQRIARKGEHATRSHPPKLVIELGDTSLRGSSRTRSGSLQQAFVIPIDPTRGLVSYAGELREQLNRRSAGDYACLIPSKWVRSSIEELPNLGAEDAAAALTLKAQRLVSNNLVGWNIDVTPLDGHLDNASVHRYLLTAIEDSKVQLLTQFFLAVGRIPRSVTLPLAVFGSLMRADVELGDEDDSLVWVVVDMMRTATEIHIYKDGVPEFSRTVEIGGDHLTAALTDIVATPRGFVELTSEEAEQLKTQVGYPTPEEDESLPEDCPLLGEQLRMMLDGKLTQIVAEVRNSIRYYQQRSGQRRIQRLSLTGTASALRGIDAYFLNALKIRTHRFTSAQLELNTSEMQHDEAESLCSQSTATCGLLGGALPGSNLLPAPLKLHRQLQRPLRWVAALSGIATLTLVILGHQSSTALASIDPGQVDKVLELQKQSQQIDQANARVELMRSQVMEIGQRLGPQLTLAELFKELSRTTPSEVTLSALVSDRRANGEALLRLSGWLTDTPNSRTPASRLLDAFSSSPFVYQARLVSLNRQDRDNESLFRFEIEITPYLRSLGETP